MRFPNLLIEVLSPETKRTDRREKTNLPHLSVAQRTLKSQTKPTLVNEATTARPGPTSYPGGIVNAAGLEVAGHFIHHSALVGGAGRIRSESGKAIVDSSIVETDGQGGMFNFHRFNPTHKIVSFSVENAAVPIVQAYVDGVLCLSNAADLPPIQAPLDLVVIGARWTNGNADAFYDGVYNPLQESNRQALNALIRAGEFVDYGSAPSV